MLSFHLQRCVSIYWMVAMVIVWVWIKIKWHIWNENLYLYCICTSGTHTGSTGDTTSAVRVAPIFSVLVIHQLYKCIHNHCIGNTSPLHMHPYSLYWWYNFSGISAPLPTTAVHMALILTVLVIQCQLHVQVAPIRSVLLIKLQLYKWYPYLLYWWYNFSCTDRNHTYFMYDPYLL